MIDEDPFEHLLREALAPTYVLVRKLGAGGMGSVYLARDPTLKRNVAVKVLSPELADDPGPRARFHREAESVAALSHPNVVAVYNVGRLANGVPYFVMQYVNGRSTADRLETDGPFDVPTAKRFLGEVASALAAAHRQGIIHRDIKPANILHDDESGRVLVSDFGIAAVVAPDGSLKDEPLNATRADIADVVMTRLTQTGAMMGTPAYMSPEQLLAEAVTPKTDVYSLGLLGYEWLTGKGPYEISSPAEAIVAHIRDTPKPLRSVRADADPEVEAVLRACLVKDPASRPSAAETATRLGHGPDVLLEWPPPGLEKLHGQLRLATLSTRIGSLLLGIPMAMVAALESGNRFREALPPRVLLASIAGIGALLLGGGSVRLLQIARSSSGAARLGHGWLTIAEVLSDHRRDGGALIVGAREYAALTVTQRNAYRLRRMLAAALGLAAGVTPMLGYFVAVWIGQLTRFGPTAMLLLVIALPVALWLAAANIGARESHALTEPRARLLRATPREAATRLVDRWRAAFEVARQGQRIGLGVIGRPLSLLVGGVMIGLTLLGVTVLSFAIGDASVTSDDPYYVESMEYSRNNATIARTEHAGAQRLAPYRGPVDSAVTPIRAGEALHAMMMYGRDHARLEHYSANRLSARPMMARATRPSPLENEPARTITGSWFPPGVDSLMLFNGAFGGTRRSRQPGEGLSNDRGDRWFWVAVSITAASKGLTPDHRRALQRIASGAPLAEFSVVAHARSTNLWGASLKLPIPDDANIPNDLATQRNFSWVEPFAYATIAQAALDLADGRPAVAEARLREVIGAGLAMLEDRATVVWILGRRLSRTGRNALAALYEVTGRPDDRNALLDTVTFVPAQRWGLNVSSRQQMEGVDSTLADSTLPPMEKWHTVVDELPILGCRDLRFLLFPHAPDYERLWSTARAALVRDSVDAAIFTFARSRTEFPNRVFAPSYSRWRWRFLRARMQALDFVVGGHRFETCTTRYW